MPATFGIGALPSGTSAPSDTAVKTATIKESVDTYNYRDENGVTKKFLSGKLKTTEVTLDVIGSPGLAAITAGAFAEGTLRMMSAKISESNDGAPEGTVTYKGYESLT